MARKRRNRIFQFGPLGMDTNLLVVLFFIMVFGFIMIYSASYYKAGMSSAFNNDSMYFLKRQVGFSMVGVLAMLVVAGVNYHWICRFAGVGYLACFGFVALLFTPLAITANEAKMCIRDSIRSCWRTFRCPWKDVPMASGQIRGAKSH